MTKTLRVQDPKELLALIPFQLGFTPSSSVVAVSLRGERKQVGLIARVDVAALESDDCEEVLHRLMIHCSQDGASRIVLVGYGPEDANASQLAFSNQTSKAFDRLRKVMQTARNSMHQLFPVDEVLAVWNGRCGHFTTAGRCTPTLTSHQQDRNSNVSHTSRELCWEHAASVDHLKATQVAAHMVYKGAVAESTRSQLGQIVDSASARKAEVAQAIREQQEDSHSGVAWREECLNLWSEITEEPTNERPSMAGLRLQPARVAALARGLKDITLRDAVLVSLTSAGVSGGLSLIRSVATHGSDGTEADRIAKQAIAEITDPKHGVKPKIERMTRVKAALKSLIEDAPVAYHSAPRTLLSLIAWWEGNGALARRHLEELHTFDQDYSLAKLAEMALDYGLAPGWLRNRGIKE